MSDNIFTYARLKADLQSWLEDAEPDFVGNIDNIIGLGEIRLLIDLDLEIFDSVDTVVIPSTGLAPKPAGYVSARTLGYTIGGVWTLIEPRTYEYVQDSAGVGNPLYRAELNQTQWLVAPAPAAPLNATLRFIKRPAGLAQGTPNTWLGDNVGPALFYACLMSSAEFTKNKDMVALWSEKYTKFILPSTKKEIYTLLRAEYGR